METGSSNERHDDDTHGGGMGYGRFAAMIATSIVVMFGIKYLNTYSVDHVQFSEMRTYMALMMGGAMAAIMLGFMLGMYRDRRINVAIFAGSAVVFGVCLWLVRSQAAVQDESYLRSMIPHHSIAILTSDRSDLSDVRVCRLAREISAAQRKEIREMEWLLEDIDAHGVARTRAEADERPVPAFEGSSARDGC